ncbi:hypothetical protein FACS1894132_01130 [Clostridia bacterium]|nr:hypothetical protein FACS1894132_01130 [Clostridia bacterium]
MKKTKKIVYYAIISLLFLAIVLMFVQIVLQKHKTVDKNTRLNYVALGDSITYGYKLPNGEKNYPTLLAENLNADLKNYAVVGQTSEELLNHLKNGDYDLKNADIITIGIGSNDLLKPFEQVIAQQLGLNPNNDIVEELFKNYHKNPLLITSKLPKIKEQLEENPVFINAVQKFKVVTFPEIINEIKKQNPNAELIVINLYNPYYGVKIPVVFNLSEISDTYISQMNETFENSDSYKTVDVHSYFQKHGMTNVELSLNELTKISIDPHPTSQGHMVIYSLINQILQNGSYNQNY